MAKPSAGVCPRCRESVRLEGPDRTKVRCPRCGAVFLPGTRANRRPRPRKPRPAGPGPVAGLTAVILALVVLGTTGGLAYWAYRRLSQERPTVPVPKAFATFQTPDHSLRCDFPSDWKHSLEGVKDHAELTFRSGVASIHIHQEFLKSAPGDPPAGGDDPERSLAAVVHERQQAAVGDEWNDYQEEEAETVRTGYGLARRSAFTAAGPRGVVRGYRATVVGAAALFEVVCQCPNADWDNLEPAFARVIQSMTPGTDP
jgi:hypothetical protein